MPVPSLNKQKKFWDDWVDRSFSWENNPDNARRGSYVLEKVNQLNQPDLNIIDVGCGSGWLACELSKYGDVTATDLSSKGIQELQRKYPNIRWIAGDFLSVELPESHFHIVTCLETIAHVPDQKAFAYRIAQVTRPGGMLLLTTQNEYIWSRTSWLQPPGDGQIRNWPSRTKLIELFYTYFSLEKIFTCAPGGNRGLPRLINNRLISALCQRLLGVERWILLREQCGLGRSLFLVGRRHEK